MLEVSVDSRKIEARLSSMGPKVRASLERQVYRTAVDLQRYIVQEKLSAEPGYNAKLLHRVTSTLARSIQQRVTSTAVEVKGEVFSAGDVPYAALHEYGGVITRYGRKVGDYTVRMPKRSFMRTSLEENKDKIVQDMRAAVQAGVHA